MKIKRLLSAFLTIAMVLSMAVVPVGAEETTMPCAKMDGCILADSHEGGCTVPETAYCDNGSCLLHKAQTHEICQYCATEGCLLKNTEHTECQMQEPPASCNCTDKCVIDARKAECSICTAATADTLSSVCIGKEPVVENCDVAGCELVKGHEGEHTGMGNFVECDGSATADVCEATEHIYGCAKFAVKDTRTLKAALDAGMTEITLTEGFTITETILIPEGKEITLDMADKEITVGKDVNPAIRILGKLTVKNGKMDTATGEDADGYCFIVGRTVDEEQIAGELTIEGGAYHGAASAVSVTKGVASIKDGSFSAEPADGMEDSRYLLNCYDANYAAGTASIVVTGGTFRDFNPGNNLAEGENTSFLGEGYCVQETESGFAVAQHSLTHVPAKGATCAAAGNLEHWSCGHCGKIYNAAENGEEIAGEDTVIPVASHNLEKQAAVPGTCEVKGTIEHWECTECEKLFNAEANGTELTQEDIEGALGSHKMQHQAAVPGTCAVKGTIEHWKCTECKKLFNAEENGTELTVEAIVGEFGTHNLQKQNALAATCQANGTIEHWKCSVCSKMFDAQQNGNELTAEQIVDADGTHDLKYQSGKPATYDGNGILAHYECEVTGCGKKFRDAEGETELIGSAAIPKLSHVEGSVLVIDEDAIANEGKKNVVLDLLQEDVMDSLTEVTQVQFQTACLDAHVERGGTLWICLSDGEVYFDNDALSTIVDKAQGDTVTLLVKEITKTDSSLTSKQKTALASQKDPYLLQLELTSGGKKITADFDGKVYVYMTSFEPKTGYKVSNYSGYLLKDDGSTEKVSYYSRDVRLTVEHFSVYFLSRNVKAASNPQTGDTSNVMVWAGVGFAAVAALAILIILNRKKKK